jgi:glycerol-1-phosphate dehydrogenase [NAD(P)+]
MTIEQALRAARETKQLRVGQGVLRETVEVFRHAFGDRPAAAVVGDPNTMRVVGDAVLAAFRAAGHPIVEPLVIDDPSLYAEWRFVEQVEASLRAHDAIPVAVGSGTINDLVKLASHRLGRPYACVATAASMDGYTAFGASITYQGSKQTFDCPAPVAVVADLDVIRAAPPAMTASGYADLLAKLTAGADWIVADALGIEPIDPTAWDLVQKPLRASLAKPQGIPTGDLDAVGPLVEGLMMGGFAMQSHKTSRPASGAEHQFSHLWDMQHHAVGGVAPSHGFKVGVATVAVARFYEALIEQPLHTLDVDAAVADWPAREQLERALHELFADQDEVRAVALREALAKYVTHDELRAQLRTLREVWPELAQKIRQHLPPSRELAAMLSAAGAPSESEQIGIPRERLRLAFYQAQPIRRRFTGLDLAVRANVLDRCLDDVFGGGTA